MSLHLSICLPTHFSQQRDVLHRVLVFKQLTLLVLAYLRNNLILDAFQIGPRRFHLATLGARINHDL